MDESQESTKTISAAKFFDKIEYVAQIANDALATSTALQSELSRVQIDLKSLIESLQVNFDSGVQNIQNQINEVTNVIIQEQDTRKSETEALEQQIFAQEDQLQKNVKGKKAKKVAPDAFAGKMRQKLREKAEKNSGILGAGLGLGLGMGLMGGGNWFTNLLPENPFKNNDNKDDKDGDNNNTEFSEENPPEGLRRVLTGMVDFVTFGATDMDFKGDLFGGDEENTNEDDEVISKIKEVLDTKIRPAVARDGGDIKFKSFKNGKVAVMLQGSCSGCPSSLMTLKQGVQNLLKHYVKEVNSVEAE